MKTIHLILIALFFFVFTQPFLKNIIKNDKKIIEAYFPVGGARLTTQQNLFQYHK